MERRRLRNVLAILTEGAGATGGKRRLDRARQVKQGARRWMAEQGVQGFGIGSKTTDGIDQDELVVKVYVEEKRPRDQIGNPVPREIRVPGIAELVKTDVVAVGRIRRQTAFPDKFRPAVPGVSISIDRPNTGTLGCLVRRQGDENLYILSSSHVLAVSGHTTSNSLIFQPSREFADDPADAIAELTKSIPIVSTDDGFPNQADAAIARVLSPALVSSIIREIDVPKGIRHIVKEHDRVQMTGCISGRQSGKVLDIDFEMEDFQTNPVSGQKERFGFRNLVLCTKFTDAGDSGAAILSQGGFLVGLHFAGSDKVSVFNRIGPICDALEIDVITERF